MSQMTKTFLFNYLTKEEKKISINNNMVNLCICEIQEAEGEGKADPSSGISFCQCGSLNKISSMLFSTGHDISVLVSSDCLCRFEISPAT